MRLVLLDRPKQSLVFSEDRSLFQKLLGLCDQRALIPATDFSTASSDTSRKIRRDGVSEFGYEDLHDWSFREAPIKLPKRAASELTVVWNSSVEVPESIVEN